MTHRAPIADEGAGARGFEQYVEAIAPEQRPLFDRIHALVLAACPTAEVTLAYKMPTYLVDDRRLHVGVWKHGVSIYGWKASGDAGFTTRHPELKASTGTIRIATEQAALIGDDEIEELARAVLLG